MERKRISFSAVGDAHFQVLAVVYFMWHAFLWLLQASSVSEGDSEEVLLLVSSQGKLQRKKQN